MLAEALAQVSSQGVIDRTTARRVGWHIAEGDTVGEGWRSRVASGMEPVCLQDPVCKRKARGAEEKLPDGGIQP